MKNSKGIMIIPAVFFILIFTVLTIKSTLIWDVELKREMEQELIFRGKQYVYAIEKYQKKNTNIQLKDLDTLLEKRFIRKLYKDPLSEGGKWNIVLQNSRSGSGSKKLMVVSEALLPSYLSKGKIIGVCSTADDVGFFEYRTKKNYNEWAFYVGAKEGKEMPELTFVKE